jgi:hypothetical protein
MCHGPSDRPGIAVRTLARVDAQSIRLEIVIFTVSHYSSLNKRLISNFDCSNISDCRDALQHYLKII